MNETSPITPCRIVAPPAMAGAGRPFAWAGSDAGLAQAHALAWRCAG